MVDVVGLTDVVDTIIARGDDGFDELAGVCSTFVGGLVRTIYAHGGDVVEFAGPTLVCIFHAGHIGGGSGADVQRAACVRAMECAWGLRTATTSKLAIRVGVSSGEMSVGLLGGCTNVWRLLLAGPCRSHLATALPDAPSAGVLVSLDVHKVISGITDTDFAYGAVPWKTSSKGDLYHVTAFTKPGSAALATTTKARHGPLTMDITSHGPQQIDYMTQIYAFIPHPVPWAVVEGTFDALRDIADATCLCVRLDGYEDVTHNRDLWALQSYLYACQEILADVGGYVSQFTVDARGCVLVALWGVPGAAFEDGPLRAVGAAVRIRNQLLEMKMPCSLAITFGPAFCGCMGHDMRRDYVALGSAVEVASVAVNRFKNDIVVDTPTLSSVGDGIGRKFRPLPSMTVREGDPKVSLVKEAF